MTITLLGNSAKAVSAANAPTSLVPTYSSGTTQGNLLVMVVACTGASPTISTPTNWTQCLLTTNSTSALAIYCWGNNPGGVTATTVNLTAPTSGGACACVFEFAGVGVNTGGIVKDNAAGQGTGTATGTVGPINNTSQLANDTLIIYAVSRAASTITPTFDPFYGWSGSQQAAVSTGSTTNVQVDTYFLECLTGPFPKMQATLGASVAWIAGYQRFASINSNFNTATVNNGVSGILVGSFYQGMIGG